MQIYREEIVPVKETKDLSKLSDEDLKKELKTNRETLLKQRFQKVVEEMVDKSVLGKTRKKIARILTILRARELQKQTSKV